MTEIAHAELRHLIEVLMRARIPNNCECPSQNCRLCNEHHWAVRSAEKALMHYSMEHTEELLLLLNGFDSLMEKAFEDPRWDDDYVMSLLNDIAHLKKGIVSVKEKLDLLRHNYTMLCAQCGYIRAQHPLSPRDCSGFEESESFRDK